MVEKPGGDESGTFHHTLEEDERKKMIKIWVKQFNFPYFGADVKNVNTTLLSVVCLRPFLQNFIFANCGTNLNINPSPAFKGPFRTATAACI